MGVRTPCQSWGTFVQRAMSDGLFEEEDCTVHRAERGDSELIAVPRCCAFKIIT